MIEQLREEIESLKDPGIQALVEYVLKKAPAYFWLVPSSSTGKYHPPQSNGQGGLMRHTRGITYFGDIFCRAYGFEKGRVRARILAACILHDIVKYGLVMGSHTTKTHDKDGADFVFNHGKEYLEENPGADVTLDDLKEICKAIAFHMGRWTQPASRAKKFPEEFTVPEVIVHLADMASAGNKVHLLHIEPVIGCG